MSDASDRLALYREAERRILTTGQSVTIDNHSLTLADLDKIEKVIAGLQAQVTLEGEVATGRFSRFSQADFGGTT